MAEYDLTKDDLTDVNYAMQHAEAGDKFAIGNPKGTHNIAVGLTSAISVNIDGPAGYFCGSMNHGATIVVNGSGGQGIASNMMGGKVHVRGNVGASCGATSHGGLIVVDGDAGARCGIAMKGSNIVIKGSVGHMSGFMGQAGTMVICGDAGDALGDSCYELTVFVKGTVKSLGTDCEQKLMDSDAAALLQKLLQQAGVTLSPADFKRYGPARKLYNFNVDDVNAHDPRRKKSQVAMAANKGRYAHNNQFPAHVIAEIQRAANEGIYSIRGGGAKRKVPNFDDLLLLGSSVSRYPLEGYREKCETSVLLGTRFAKKPISLAIPITIAGMSFGALSAPAKEALGRGASEVGTSTTTGDGGMTPEERGQSKTLVYQYLPSRYGMNPVDLRKADAIEVVLGQGAKPGGGGMLLGQKISDRVAQMRTLPKGVDQRSACRHPDWTGPDDLEIKIAEIREITNWQKPIYVKVGATRTYYDVKLAVKAGADVVVVDGMQGGTAATQDVFIEHVGIPTLPAVRQAVTALKEMGMHRKVQLIVSGGIKDGADTAKALAMGADAVAVGTAMLHALGDNAPELEEEYNKLGTTAGHYDAWHKGRCPAGISTQDQDLMARLDPLLGGRRIANYLRCMTLELQTLARACGKSHVHNLDPEDLCALTVESAAMAGVPLAGTRWIPGNSGHI